ncbi:hypothetical protein SLA2020_503620 [Shorea laevis]
MENSLFYLPFSFLFFLLAIKFILPTKPKYKNLPPSPFALPILGHLHLLKEPFHRTLHNLSEKYGSVFSLRIGSRLMVVVSSPSAIEECFVENDVIFANRPRFSLGEYCGYNYTTIGLVPYGDHWRNTRRILNIEFLATKRLNMTSDIRTDEIKNLLRKVYDVSRSGFAKVELKPLLSELTLNIIMRMMACTPFSGERARQFTELKEEFFSMAVPSYPGDFLPILKWIDYNGFMKKAKWLGREIDAFTQSLIDQHRSEDKDGSKKDTLIGHLLSLQQSEPEYCTEDTIKGILQDILIAGTDTTALTLEWAMSNLLNHPDVLKKAWAELENQVGPDQLVNEADLSNLPYLQNVITETQRLFPAAQLLLAHMSSDYCTIKGYDIPPGTMLLINAWAMHRDPELWEDPTSFKPERHEQGKEHNKLITFGMGRRACPGVGLAQRVLGQTLGSLIQCFEWEKVDRKDINMVEGTGASLPKVVPLQVMCKARPLATKVFSKVV